MLTFDEVEHVYRWNGAVVPGVTTIIKSLYDFEFISELTLEQAGKRGTAVHYACELYDKGTLDEAGIENWEHFKYFDAWRKFKAETGFEIEMNEQRLFHRSLKYAGTLDRYGRLFDKPAVVDIKTTSVLSPAIGTQLAGYEEALKSDPEWKGPNKIDRYAVQLRSDGTYRLEQYKEATDWSVFVGLLNLNRWKEKHGYK